jgi:hypothetical protein
MLGLKSAIVGPTHHQKGLSQVAKSDSKFSGHTGASTRLFLIKINKMPMTCPKVKSDFFNQIK